LTASDRSEANLGMGIPDPVLWLATDLSTAQALATSGGRDRQSAVKAARFSHSRRRGRSPIDVFYTLNLQHDRQTLDNTRFSAAWLTGRRCWTRRLGNC